jgi:hypothetical protein
MESSPQQQELFNSSELREVQSANYEILDSEDLRERYLHLTDKLINRIERDDIDCLVFLDKSARPVAWFVKELWPLVHEGKDSRMPEFYFLNIDREQWRPLLGSNETGSVRVENLPKEQVEDLRSIFTEDVIPANQPTEGKPTRLDNKNVLIVDEMRVSGDTLDTAKKMLKRAIPEATIEGAWWMIPKIAARPGQPMANQEIPVWYSDETNLGRGVANRDQSKSSMSSSRRQQRGGLFLSTKFRNPDPLSNQLREEIKQLVRDVANRKIIYMPDVDRDDLYELFERINGFKLSELNKRS